MGYKRRRDQHDFRPRSSPGEEALLKSRSEIARIGEPSRFAREGRMRNLLSDLNKVPEEFYSQLLETVRAVIYEQPHKIGYLGQVLSEAPDNLTFYIVEMAQDELVKALNDQDWPRFKLYLRFLCSMHSVISNTQVLIDCLNKLVEKSAELAANETTVNVATEFYKSALFASLYLPKDLITPDLREKFVQVSFTLPAGTEFEYFRGEERPYEIHTVSSILLESAKALKENDWNANILARNPLDVVKPASDSQSSNQDIQMEDVKEDKADEHTQDAPTDERQEDSKEGSEEKEEKEEKSNEESASQDNPEAEGAEEGKQETTEDAMRDVEGDNKEEGSEQTEKPRKTQHTLQSIHIPELKSLPVSSAQDLHFRCYLPIDGVDTVPPENSVAGLLLRDVAIDNIKHMDFNRREVVRQLIVLDEFFSKDIFATPGIWIDQLLSDAKEFPEKPTWKIEDVALEAIFSQMFSLSQPAKLSFPDVYYHTQLIEACIIAPQDVAPVLGRGLRFLFNNLISADAEVLFRMVDWFAHHVSNFAFTWKWNEWLDTLKLPETHPQQVFIRELLAKQVRLSYPQRVRDVLPAEFQDLVPNPPDVPGFKYENDELAQALLESLRESSNPKSPSATDDTYDPEASTSVKQEESGPRAILAKAEHPGDLLIHALCHLGNRSVTHAATWIHKAESLISEFCTDPVQLVGSVFEYWNQSSWIGALVLEQFVRSKFITINDIIRYIATRQDLLLSSVGWEQLSRDAATSLETLKAVEINGEYGTWWKERLEVAFDRIAKQDSWATVYTDFVKASAGDKAKNETNKEEESRKELELPLLTAKPEMATEEEHVSEEEEGNAPKRQKKEV